MPSARQSAASAGCAMIVASSVTVTSTASVVIAKAGFGAAASEALVSQTVAMSIRVMLRVSAKAIRLLYSNCCADEITLRRPRAGGDPVFQIQSCTLAILI